MWREWLGECGVEGYGRGSEVEGVGWRDDGGWSIVLGVGWR